MTLPRLHLRRLERDGACQLEAVLYSEGVADGSVAALLPVNALRNAATLPARTAYIAMLDVDLLPSRTFLATFTARHVVPRSCSADGPCNSNADRAVPSYAIDVGMQTLERAGVAKVAAQIGVTIGPLRTKGKQAQIDMRLEGAWVLALLTGGAFVCDCRHVAMSALLRNQRAMLVLPAFGAPNATVALAASDGAALVEDLVSAR